MYIFVLDNVRNKKQGYFGFLYKDGSSITFESPSNKVMDGYFYGNTKANDISNEVTYYVSTFAEAVGKFTNKTQNSIMMDYMWMQYKIKQ